MKEKDTFTAWVTKYALTSGIIKVQAEWDCDRPEMIYWGERMERLSAHGKDWHRLESDAKSRADDMRRRKIAVLEAQIAKLKAMKF